MMMLKLGMVPTVVLSSPEGAREAMKTHDADCCSRSDSPGLQLLSYGYRDVAFSPYSEYVHEMRKQQALDQRYALHAPRPGRLLRQGGPGLHFSYLFYTGHTLY
ncbi:hypothetical protein ABZP36_020328 [Zizania latifolia]